MNPDPEPLALDELLTLDERRTITVDDHAHFLSSISTDERGVDEIDRAVAEDGESEREGLDP